MRGQGRERKSSRGGKEERERERASAYACVYVCVCVCERESRRDRAFLLDPLYLTLGSSFSMRHECCDNCVRARVLVCSCSNTLDLPVRRDRRSRWPYGTTEREDIDAWVHSCMEK